MDCGKKQYNTYYEADRALKKIKYKHKRRKQTRTTKRREKRIYKCSYCGAYHLTKQKEKWMEGRK
jgi:hypothetical protein